MVIFLSHYRHTDYEQELYAPLRDSEICKNHEVIMPHAHGSVVNTKDDVLRADLVLAEVSHSATGVGIEIGWADAAGKRIVCMFKSGVKPSNSLQFVTKDFIEYESATDMVQKLSAFLAAHV